MPSTSRAQSIDDFPVSSTKKNLHGLLGMVNFDRDFIPKLAELTNPLYLALNGDQRKLECDNELQACFNEIKENWKKGMELYMPDMISRFILESDASKLGLGCTLRQKGRPIYHISRVLKGAEKNYTITERELLAALWGMEKLKYFLLGRKFTLIIDHKPLESLFTKKEFGNRRMTRWMDRLSRFDFDIVYKEGDKMVSADSLSRNIYLSGERHTETESELKTKILTLHKEWAHRKNIKKDLEEMGINLTHTQIKNLLKNCIECAGKDKFYFKSSKFYITKEPGERIAFDLMDYNKKKKILIGIDYFSQFVFGKCIDSKNAGRVVEFIKDTYAELPFKTLHTDNGKEFNNELMRKWTENKNIKHEFVAHITIQPMDELNGQT